MGNVMDRKVVTCSEARATTHATPTPCLTPKQEQESMSMKPEMEQSEQKEIVPNLTFHLFSYRQQMGCKKHQLMKWATSKLLLTEELLKLHRQHIQSTTESWTNYENLLSDEEDEENKAPAGQADDPLAQELCHLKNYRLELRGTIVEVAQEKMKKREKKKLKRLKRRTLISSKKPSNKNKHKLGCFQQDLEEHLTSDPQNQPEVIVID
ncbi:uncharacterized protein LOC128261779 [Drosophila gunungcola]|uniref:uncharacterized protein LOC128261779 n=1 Tax=Drosophila gunungcola TaxID=103775 RepID=UPI0022E5B881|nr:uncharacterized protein LOC128261779 [Drosophila gunungcola]XP_052851598.1 uncharacterized protein LOC128261779 [Drosophila gunungcola]XP_052851600.1 uncharacterized protein LOC128261779 [Drosophila gunungcola]XP_052851601.1 uncharacterized protein LOC128261779 [Drosophila gunungcola]